MTSALLHITSLLSQITYLSGSLSSERLGCVVLLQTQSFVMCLMKNVFVVQPSLSVLYMLSDGATHEAVHLLCRMLVFDPVSSDALTLHTVSCLMFVLNIFSWKNKSSHKVSGCFHLVSTRLSALVSRLNGSPAATLCPTRTWTKVACVTTPACVSAATPFPAGEFTPETSSRSPSVRSATATRTACCPCGREKVRRVPSCPVSSLTLVL